MAAWPVSGAVQPMEASFQECLGTGRCLCSETETTRKVTGELLWSVEKQVRTESKDIASEAGKRKSTGWRSMGWQLSSISSPSRAAYKASFPGVFRINGPETYGFYFPRNSDVFHNEVENCSENTHQRLPQVLEPSKRFCWFLKTKSISRHE